jgi:hypothetical protein
VCVSLGLKKLGDFTVSEGHGYPLVLYNESKHNNILLALVGKRPIKELFAGVGVEML